MRPLVEGVVSREQVVDPVVGQGRLEDQSGYVLEIPQEVVTRAGGMAALEQRGRARYGIYCAPCHDGTGSGQGMVTKRAQATGAAAFAPPTFHQDRIRHMPDGQLFATISNGKNNMPPYAMQIPVDDRWGIVAYVRALEVAQPKMAGAAAPADTAAAKTDTTPKPAPSGSAAPATSGSAAPATSGSAAPATSGSAAPNATKDGGKP
jgi:mono/diheme cytochrome c family protein